MQRPNDANVLLSSRLRKNSASRRFWEGTSSTRAVTAWKSTAASSRWGKLRWKTHFPQLLRQVIKEIVLRHLLMAASAAVIGLGLERLVAATADWRRKSGCCWLNCSFAA